MKPKNTIATTIFYLSIFVIVGVLVIALGIHMIIEQEVAGPFMICFLFGGIFIFAGIFAIVSTVKNRPDRAYLKKSGQKCNGVIIEIVPDTSTTLNGRHPNMARCHVVDCYTGEPFEVTSTGYMSDLTKYVMREVDVYIDRRDRKKYFVDIEKLVAEYDVTLNSTNTHDYRE